MLKNLSEVLCFNTGMAFIFQFNPYIKIFWRNLKLEKADFKFEKRSVYKELMPE